MLASGKPLISVVLCTHNRVNLLPKVLSGLLNQSLNTSAYEIIVVDNASTDNTSAVLGRIQVQFPTAPLRSLYEPSQGLGYARNTGWSNAHSRYVAFIDDDCLPAKNWLQVLLDCFHQLKPEPWSVGGKIIPVYDAPKPSWFKDAYETDTWGEQARVLKEGESFTGCNMSWRKDILEEYGGFDVTYDMKGASLLLAGDTELYRRIWSRSADNCVFYYMPQAIMHHTIDPYKMTVSYQLKRAFMSGQASCAMAQLESLLHKSVLFFGSIAQLMWKSLLALSRIRPRHNWRNWAVEELYPVMSHCGRFMAFLGVRTSFRQRTTIVRTQCS